MANNSNTDKSYRTLTRREEIINSITHGAGVIFSVFALVILFMQKIKGASGTL